MDRVKLGARTSARWPSYWTKHLQHQLSKDFFYQYGHDKGTLGNHQHIQGFRQDSSITYRHRGKKLSRSIRIRACNGCLHPLQSNLTSPIFFFHTNGTTGSVKKYYPYFFFNASGPAGQVYLAQFLFLEMFFCIKKLEQGWTIAHRL